MERAESVVAVFASHMAAETAVKELVANGFAMSNLSVVGKGFHSEEKIIGFYNAGDRIRFWGKRGAFWDGLWGLFSGGLFLTTPVIGHVVVLGYLATMIIAAVENAIVVGGLSAIGAALYGMGIPKDSILDYETAIEADSFLVMARGTATRIAGAEDLLEAIGPSSIDVHACGKIREPVKTPV